MNDVTLAAQDHHCVPQAAPNEGSARSTYERYLNAWSALDSKERTRALEATLLPDAIYSDLVTDAVGRQGVSERLAEFQATNPRYRFQLHRYEQQNGLGRAEWIMRDACGIAVMPGCDIVEFGDDGLIWSISGFFGAPPLQV